MHRRRHMRLMPDRIKCESSETQPADLFTQAVVTPFVFPQCICPYVICPHEWSIVPVTELHLCVLFIRRKKVVMMNVSSCPRVSCWCFSLPAATRSVFTPFKAQLWLLLSTNLQKNPTPAFTALLLHSSVIGHAWTATFPPACNTEFKIKKCWVWENGQFAFDLLVKMASQASWSQSLRVLQAHLANYGRKIAKTIWFGNRLKNYQQEETCGSD